jgi:PKD repeat protein
MTHLTPPRALQKIGIRPAKKSLMLMSLSIGMMHSIAAQSFIHVNETKGCSPHTVSLQSDVTQTARKFEWHFGDGQISKEKQPVHVYEKGGAYTPYLVIYKKGNEKDTLYFESPILVLSSPTANFASPKTMVCERSKVELTPQIKAGSAPIQSYAWNMGNGTTYYKEKIAHAYPSAGVYNVTLKVTDQNGCVASVEKPAFYTVQESPSVQLLVTPLYENAIPFTARIETKSLNAVAIKHTELSFGDGSKAPVSFAEHTYWTSGVYTITASVEGINGCIGRASHTQIVNQRALPLQTVSVQNQE